jgi:hypothetical protein
MAYLRDTADEAHAQWVREAAQRIADSGMCSGWRAVETALVERGYRDAPSMLADVSVRAELNVRCARARSRAGAALRGALGDR